MKKYLTTKIKDKTFKVGYVKRRFGLNTSRSLCIVNHKNKWTVVLTDDDWSTRTYRTCDKISRSEALRIISFLTDFVNLVKPTEATALAASIKASTNRTLRVASELSAIAVNAEMEIK